jgi:hypothetical protein
MKNNQIKFMVKFKMKGNQYILSIQIADLIPFMNQEKTAEMNLQCLILITML